MTTIRNTLAVAIFLACGCYSAPEEEHPAEPPAPPNACLAEAERTSRWPAGCSDADPPGPHSPLGWYPAPEGCERPAGIACELGTCSALYVCDHSKRVRIDAFTWCDLGQPQGFVCYWTQTPAE
jgi:hypothetical protein